MQGEGGGEGICEDKLAGLTGIVTAQRQVHEHYDICAPSIMRPVHVLFMYVFLLFFNNSP